MFCGDDPAAKSSTLAATASTRSRTPACRCCIPATSRTCSTSACTPSGCPGSPGAWVGLKVVTSVADGIGTRGPRPRPAPPADLGDVLVEGQPWHHQPLATVGSHAVPDQEALVLVRRLAAAQAYARRAGLDRVTGAPVGGAARRGVRGQDLLRRARGVQTSGRARGAGVRVLKLGHDLSAGRRRRCSSSPPRWTSLSSSRRSGRSSRPSCARSCTRHGSAVPVLGQARPVRAAARVVGRRARPARGGRDPHPGPAGSGRPRVERHAAFRGTDQPAAAPAARPPAGVLQRLPAQPVHRRPRRCAGRRRGRLSRDHVLRGAAGGDEEPCRRRRWAPRASPGWACRRSWRNRT